MRFRFVFAFLRLYSLIDHPLFSYLSQLTTVLSLPPTTGIQAEIIIGVANNSAHIQLTYRMYTQNEHLITRCHQ